MGQWKELPDAGLPLGGAWGDPSLFVNCPGQPSLGVEFIRLLAQACETIMVMNPLLGDTRAVDALIAARQRGAKVHVITELRENRGKGVRIPTRGFEADRPVGLEEHFRNTRRLAGKRVLCRGLPHYAHAKMVLVDGEILLLSSMNCDANSLGWGPRPSVEAGLRITDPAAVSAWVETFEQLWQSCPFRMHLLDNSVSLQQVPVKQLPPDAFIAAGSTGARMCWSYPPDRHGLRDSLVDLVSQARAKIILVALSFYDTNLVGGLHAALQEALARGVKVCVVVRPEHFKPSQYPDPSTRDLLERSLQLYGTTALHAKGILVDRTLCGIFSGNINPYSLDSREEAAHVECGLIGPTDSKPFSAYARFLEELLETATHRYEL